MGVSVGVKLLGSRYILIRAPAIPMPLFDGAIHFLGCRTLRKRGSFDRMRIDKYCDLKTIWTAYS
jgi:hypothetical protein